MTNLRGITLAITLSLAPAATLWADPPLTPVSPQPSMANVQSAYGQLPLSFETNQGQTDPQVKFLSRGRGYTLCLTPSDAVLTLRTGEAKGEGREGNVHQGKTSITPPPSSHSVRMTFQGAHPQAEMVGINQLPGIVNYFIGDDPSKWRTHIPTYQKVQYKNVYDGIDLVYYGNQGQLEYDLIVAPGADPTQIILAFDGAERIQVDQHGDLVLTVPQSSMEAAGGAAATLRLHKPVVYQRDEHGKKHLLASTYVLVAAETADSRPAPDIMHANETPHVAFQVAAYDASQPLIIDPVLSWATYLGGSGDDRGSYSGIAVDAAGSAYVIGSTNSPNFPGTAGSSIQSTLNSGGDHHDVFVTKLNAAGTALVYSTYLGGSNDDRGYGIAVDAAGSAYVIGTTGWDGTAGFVSFPGTASSLIQSQHSSQDAFVTKLNAAGTALVYSTYLGGSSSDAGNSDTGIGIAVDQAGNAYVTGRAGTSFPVTAGTLQSTLGGAFVAKINAAGTALVYSTVLGASGGEAGRGIAVDQAGSAYVTGSTNSPNFPGTAGSLIQNTFGGGSGQNDAFVTKLNAAGTALVYSTYLGGSGDDNGSGIAVDQAGSAYVTGSTNSPNFPGTAGSLIQSIFGGDVDAFVTKLNAAGTALVYSTYLGGSGGDNGFGMAVDQAGSAYVSGYTTTPGSGFPGTAGSSIQNTFGGGPGDAFVTKLNATGTALVYSTYLGGSGDELGIGIAVDQAGSAYVSGYTTTPGSGFPGTAGSSIQSTFGGGPGDAFVAKISDSPALFALGAAPTQLTVSAGQSASTTITVTPDVGFTQPVSFGCGGLPVGASCAFNPANVTPAGGPVNTTLTISTNGGPVAQLLPGASPTMFASLLVPFVLIPVGVLVRLRGSDRRLLSLTAGFITVLALAGILSCSGSDSSTPPPSNSGGGVPATGTPAGTSTVTVTATSGSGNSGVPITLIVTR